MPLALFPKLARLPGTAKTYKGWKRKRKPKLIMRQPATFHAGKPKRKTRRKRRYVYRGNPLQKTIRGRRHIPLVLSARQRKKRGWSYMRPGSVKPKALSQVWSRCVKPEYIMVPTYCRKPRGYRG